jgi:RimJ/RimL family protein N-acetyltransferase
VNPDWLELAPGVRCAVFAQLAAIARPWAAEHHEDEPKLGIAWASRDGMHVTAGFVVDAREWVRPLSGSEYWLHWTCVGTARFAVTGDTVTLVKHELGPDRSTLVEERHEDTHDWMAPFQGTILSPESVRWQFRLKTPRLLLRDFVEADWKAVHDYASDAEVVRDMIWGPNTEAQTREFIGITLEQQRRRPREQYGLAIEFEATLVGACRLEVQDGGKKEADLGYVLNRAYWKRGIATEAARGLLKFGFGELKLHRIWATCDPENAASIRVLEKIGMQREGRMREHQLIKGRWRDSLLFAILDRDWNAIA